MFSSSPFRSGVSIAGAVSSFEPTTPIREIGRLAMPFANWSPCSRVSWIICP